MKFVSSLLLMTLLPLLAQANPVAVGEADPVAVSEALAPRADRACHVTTSDVKCRKGAGTKYGIVKQIQPDETFGVRCKAYGEQIATTKVWDWIPGWKCWVTAHYTSEGCEKVPWC